MLTGLKSQLDISVCLEAGLYISIQSFGEAVTYFLVVSFQNIAVTLVHLSSSL